MRAAWKMVIGQVGGSRGPDGATVRRSLQRRRGGTGYFLVNTAELRIVTARRPTGGRGDGGIAQLVERFVRNEEVRGSNPLTSTPHATNGLSGAERGQKTGVVSGWCQKVPGETQLFGRQTVVIQPASSGVRRPCPTRGCRNLARRGRTRCCTCRDRAWRERHPAGAAFANLKKHARERGIAFDLSFAEFEAFAARTGYLDRRGRQRDQFHVDRIVSTEGYHAANLQALTNAQNVAKQHRELAYALGPRHTRATILAEWREFRAVEGRAA